MSGNISDSPRKSNNSEIWTTWVGSHSRLQVKMFTPKGEFGWHVHSDEDELFVAISGEFILKLRNQDILMKKGDSFLVKKGVEHNTFSKEEAQAIVIRSSIP